MKAITRIFSACGMVLLTSAFHSAAYSATPKEYDASRYRYTHESSSVFENKNMREVSRLNSMIEGKGERKTRANESFENPETFFSFPPSDIMGDIEAPDGEMWFYTGKFVYHEIPPHDNVMFTQRLLQEYTFTIYDSEMNEVGTIKDKIHYREGEKRAPLCEITPVLTRNFFNTTDDMEVMVAVGINPADRYGVYYKSYVYTLGAEKDENGYDQPIMVFNSLLGDMIEGPRSEDGSDNFYFTFMGGGGRDDLPEKADGGSFWDNLLAMREGFAIYGKALDESGPRILQRYSIPLIQLPGDQESVPPMFSVRHGGNVYFIMQQYKEPFYNRYDDPINADLTQREGNGLLIDIFKTEGEGIIPVSHTEIPVELDPMPNADGDPTALFSYFSISNLRYKGDVLFDAPGTEPDKPDFIVTRSNYQPSSDGSVDSYFTYRNDGTLKNTLCIYSRGSRALGNIDGFEPQQMFVGIDTYGYVYKFVDIYSAKVAAEITADYYYEDDSDSELLSVNCARKPEGDSYVYVFELRYPLVDENENDILRFMYINADGSYNHTDYINMGQGVAYAQSYLTTEALQPHAYSVSDAPAYMMLIKRSEENSNKKIEELMVAEAMTEENPEGKPLLICGPKDYGVLTSIVPEFGHDGQPGHLFVYYYDSSLSLLSLELFNLPLNADLSDVSEIDFGEDTGFSINGDKLTSEAAITVISTDGRLIANGAQAFDLSSLEKGTYIVISGGKSIKLIR